MTPFRRRGALLLVVAALGCSGDGGDDEGVPCGDQSCFDGEFCLTLYDGVEETEACAALPDSCESVDQMCFDDPEPCADDWLSTVCPDHVGGGCSGFGETVVRCDLPSTTTTYKR